MAFCLNYIWFCFPFFVFMCGGDRHILVNTWRPEDNVVNFPFTVCIQGIDLGHQACLEEPLSTETPLWILCNYL